MFKYRAVLQRCSVSFRILNSFQFPRRAKRAAVRALLEEDFSAEGDSVCSSNAAACVRGKRLASAILFTDSDFGEGIVVCDACDAEVPARDFLVRRLGGADGSVT